MFFGQVFVWSLILWFALNGVVNRTAANMKVVNNAVGHHLNHDFAGGLFTLIDIILNDFLVPSVFFCHQARKLYRFQGC